MNIVIRTDASNLIGTGHLMRCLTLADYLCQEGAEVSFICRKQPGMLSDLVSERGFEIHLLPSVTRGFTDAAADDYAAWLGVPQWQDAQETSAILSGITKRADWLLVDHYGLDYEWESALREQVGRILVIDDLANRRHDCDLLLDQNFYLKMESRYEDRVPNGCRTLLGPQYAILRPEFIEARSNLRTRDGSIKKMLIFYGGCDVTGETVKAMQALLKVELKDITFDVVVGVGNLRRDEIRSYCERISGADFYTQVANMAELMERADLALGAGGTTTWERCFLGLPAITTTVADNQRVMLEAMASVGAIWHLGNQADVTAADIAAALMQVGKEPDRLRGISRVAFEVMGEPWERGRHPLVEALMDEA